jgi:MoaA/NifB/PqqE/SkfB family radical SAM enzyme
MSQSKFICSLPFEHISVHPHGVSSVCCEANFESSQSFARKDGKMLNVKNGVENIMNSDTYKEIRKQMMNGEIPQSCTKCYKVEQSGGFSKRQFVTSDRTDFTCEEDGTIKVDLKNVEVRLGNFCNLKCRGCNAESSTSWIQDYHKLKNKVRLQSSYDSVIKDEASDYSWADSEEFYQDLFSVSENLELLQISGGEPFLVDKHSLLLDKLIENKQCNKLVISYVTNANYNIEKVKYILEKLKNFKQVHISVSIDDVGDRNTYMRGLSNWDLTIKNLKELINTYNFNFTITQTVNVYNFLYIEELHEYLKENGINLHIIVNHIFDPNYLSVNVLPQKVRKDKIDSLKGKIPDYYYNDIFGKYYNTECNGLFGEFLKYTREVDKIRNESFEKTLPKLNQIINII